MAATGKTPAAAAEPAPGGSERDEEAAAPPAQPGGQDPEPGAAPLPDGAEWFTADGPLFIYNPEAGAAPVRAYSPGDRVHRAAVEANYWHDLVSVPEWAAAPPAPATERSSSEEQT